MITFGEKLEREQGRENSSIGFAEISNRCRRLANEFANFTTQTTADAIAKTISR